MTQKYKICFLKWLNTSGGGFLSPFWEKKNVQAAWLMWWNDVDDIHVA